MLCNNNNFAATSSIISSLRFYLPPLNFLLTLQMLRYSNCTCKSTFVLQVLLLYHVLTAGANNSGATVAATVLITTAVVKYIYIIVVVIDVYERMPLLYIYINKCCVVQLFTEMSAL